MVDARQGNALVEFNLFFMAICYVKAGPFVLGVRSWFPGRVVPPGGGGDGHLLAEEEILSSHINNFKLLNLNFDNSSHFVPCPASVVVPSFLGFVGAFLGGSVGSVKLEAVWVLSVSVDPSVVVLVVLVPFSPSVVLAVSVLCPFFPSLVVDFVSVVVVVPVSPFLVVGTFIPVIWAWALKLHVRARH